MRPEFNGDQVHRPDYTEMLVDASSRRTTHRRKHTQAQQGENVGQKSTCSGRYHMRVNICRVVADVFRSELDPLSGMEREC